MEQFNVAGENREAYLPTASMVVGRRYPINSMVGEDTKYGNTKKVIVRDETKTMFTYLSKAYAQSVSVEFMDQINLHPLHYSLIYLGKDGHNAHRFRIV